MGLFESIGTGIGNLIAGRQAKKLSSDQIREGKLMEARGKLLSQMNPRPELDIAEMGTPESINKMAQLSKARQYQNMPGLTQAQNQMGQASAGAINALKEMGSGSEAMGSIGNLYAQNLAAGRDLNMQNAAFKERAEGDYLNSLQELGQWEDRSFMFNADASNKEFEWNQAQPYLNAQQKAAMLEQMGKQAQWEGLKNKYGAKAEIAQGMGTEIGSMFDQGSEMLGQILGVGGAGGGTGGGLGNVLTGGAGGFIA